MKRIAFVCGSSPEFLGGMEVLQKNLIEYVKRKRLPLEFSWIYPGNSDRNYTYKGISCHEIKTPNVPILREYVFSRRVLSILNQEKFDVINTHANWGYCLKHYRKVAGQKIVHTYHGVTYPYYKVQFERFGSFKYAWYPLLWFIKPLESPPLRKADELIAVSEKVGTQLRELYHTTRKIIVLRTGVNLSLFKPGKKSVARKKLGLSQDNTYLLYSGRGGYWNKGLDRAVNLVRELSRMNNKIKLLVLGANKKKCAHFLHESFIDYRGIVSRERLPEYHVAADLFLSLSRYEGGAPTLTLSEAVASGCPIAFSVDSQPEIFRDGIDGLQLEEFGEGDALRIRELLKNKKLKNSFSRNAWKKVRPLSLDSWSNKYLRILIE